MFRRARKSITSLDRKQEELARQESELRNEMEKLERLIEAAPRMAEETSRRQREELLRRAQSSRSRLEVSVALQDKRYGDEDTGTRRLGALRKVRREGRLLFIILAIALCLAVIWLTTHLHF
jgi:septal ring factor EnvC (AmiA/AmiB activator)